MKKRWSFLLSLIFFVGFLNLTIASAAPKPSDEVNAKVATFNIQAGSGADGKYDLNRIASALSEMDADVIGLQEVDVHWGSRSDYEDTIRLLAKKLHMHYYFAPIYDFDPDTEGAPRRQFGVGILSKYSIIRTENHFITRLSTQDTDPIPTLAPGFLQADIDIDGAAVSFFVTHLDYRPDPAVRIMQVSDMMEIMSENTYSILMGDMNAGPEAEELSPLLRWFQDGWDLQGEEPGYTYPSNAPEKRIDYIFASKRMQVNASGLGLSGPSDHVPVTAELTLAPGGHSLSIAGMQMLVDLFAKRGEITDDLSAHQLWLHLSAVQHYKKQSKEDKALKHMRSIQVLLKELRKEQTVSDEAYDVLRGDAVYLMNKWQSGI